MDTPWYKNAVLYSLDVETFYDSNADGIGDFQGLIGKLDYIAALGATCLWLLPFFPSPNRDNGYDVADYYNVDGRLGTLGDFTAFMQKADALGIKVIIDLVVNHTSVAHPWFLEAVKDRRSPHRDFYVWADAPLPYEKEKLMLKGEVDTMWTYHEEAGQYYLHRFYKEQPDLNIANPKVQEEVFHIVRFWLRLGVAGFRIDAAQLLIEPYGLPNTSSEALLGFVEELRRFVQQQQPDALLLAEVNAVPEEMQTFMQGNKRMNMLFNFFVNQHLFLSLARKNKHPLTDALKKLQALQPQETWLHFLRHHDELSLRLLPPKEQEELLQQYAPRPDMRIFGDGVRRRLAPMMEADKRQLKLAYSLLFSMPGIAMIRYGDEIGMGDDLSLQGRTSVRTPMQWSNSAHAGFSTAPAAKLVHPVIDRGDYAYQQVNVQAAQQNPGSLLNWIEQLIATRRQCPEIGLGKLTVVEHEQEALLIHSYQWQQQTLYCLHNLGTEACTVALNTIAGEQKLAPVFADCTATATDITLEAYGFCWLRPKK